MERNLFELLRDKRIIAILDGDRDFGEIETTDVKGNIKDFYAILEWSQHL